MGSVDDALQGASQLQAALKPGVETIGQQQSVTFTQYVRVVLPADGYVFWVRADILTLAMLKLAIKPATTVDPAQIVAKGSLHYATDQQQTETATYGTNRVVFTSETEVQEFNVVSPSVIYIGTFNGLRFAFANRSSYFKQADLHHYTGFAIYSTMATQIIDDPAQLQLDRDVVSSSLPAWLALNIYAPLYPTFVDLPKITLYPSFLVPDNIVPPYGAVHVLPETTTGVQASAAFNSSMSRSQLVSEKVRLTFYGLRNDDVLAFIDAVSQYTLDTDAMGLMNIPVVRDERVPQSELSILAQKKTVDFEVNYYQATVRNLSRQLIVAAFLSYYPQ